MLPVNPGNNNLIAAQDIQAPRAGSLCGRMVQPIVSCGRAVYRAVGPVFSRIALVIKTMAQFIASLIFLLILMAGLFVFYTVQACRGKTMEQANQEMNEWFARLNVQNFIPGLRGLQVERRAALDPSINRDHFARQLPALVVPELEQEINLEGLKQFDPDVNLTRFVDNINSGCVGIVGVPAEAGPFRDRLQKLAKHVLYELQNGEQLPIIKKAVCEGLFEASHACAPRHMEELEHAYQILCGVQMNLSTPDEILRLSQKLRVEIVDRLTHQRGGNVHARTGIMQAIGEEFQIPGYEGLRDGRDMFAEQFNRVEIKEIFHALYTSQAHIDRVSQAVNVPANLQEISRQKIVEWFMENIPANYQPNVIERRHNYMTEKVYTEDLTKIKPEAIRDMLERMGILVAQIG